MNLVDFSHRKVTIGIFDLAGFQIHDPVTLK
jgi:hypothetical protein